MNEVLAEIQGQMQQLRQAGEFKRMRVLASAMGPVVRLAAGAEVVNLCSNDYLGLANHPDVLAGARAAMDRHGFGTASVRFICGTLAIHLELEQALAEFCSMARATTYVSCWNANEALLPALLGAGDAVVSDELNHASSIDACRLCGREVRRLIYKHGDMAGLADRLAEAGDARRKLIITDGVFSMEGDLANLPEIVALAARHGALVAVDDSHAHGVVGRTGRGTPEHFGVNVDIVTGTLGKALGGAAGGFIAAAEPLIELMVQRSRPQLFSNALPPAIAGGALAALRLLAADGERVGHLQENVNYLRGGLTDLGYKALPSPSAIIPILVGETARAMRLAGAMLAAGVLITGFGYPVVPEGTARLRAQVSAAHTRNHLDAALRAFGALRGEVLEAD